MKKSNSKSKALGAFKKLGAVVLITATIFFVACKQTNGGGESTPKHAINFSVEGGNGTLKAKAYGVAETTTSPINVEEGKTVTFTATANAGYRVKGWTLDGNAITEAGTNTEYKLKVSKAVTVKVSFEEIPPTKYTVTLNQTSNGTVTASPEIPEDKKVDKDTEITFTAEANAGYKIGKWTVTPAEALQANTGADGSPTAKVKITANTIVSVSFESNSTPTPTKYTVTLTQAGGGKVTASPEIPADKLMPKDSVITFTAQADAGYKIGKWTVTPAEALQDGTGADGSPTAKVKIIADTTVSVSFEAKPEQAILTLDPNKLTINVKARTADGSDIAVEGCNETTLKSNVKTELHATGTTVILKGNITGLNCSSNYYNMWSVTALNVQGLTALKELDCSYNKLTELNVQGLTALKELDCSYNQLTELNVQGLTALKELWCGNNQLTSLDVQGLTALKDIRCFDNQLTALNVQGCASLQELSCHRNQLTELNVQGLTALQELDCRGNEIASLNAQGCTTLLRLNCTENKLNAQAMTALLNALPTRQSSYSVYAVLYTENTDKQEGNCKDYTQPESLKNAFKGAKSRNWKLKKFNASGKEVDI